MLSHWRTWLESALLPALGAEEKKRCVRRWAVTSVSARPLPGTPRGHRANCGEAVAIYGVTDILIVYPPPRATFSITSGTACPLYSGKPSVFWDPPWATWDAVSHPTETASSSPAVGGRDANNLFLTTLGTVIAVSALGQTCATRAL